MIRWETPPPVVFTSSPPQAVHSSRQPNSVVDGLAAPLPQEREGHSDVPAELADLTATEGHRIDG